MAMGGRNKIDMTHERRIFGAIFAAIVATLGLLWYRGNRPPTIALPPPPAVPAVNAFDDFNRAYGLLKDENLINSSLVAGVLLKPDLSNSLKGISDADAQRIDSENAPVFAALRVGLTHAYVAPTPRTFDQTFPWLAHERELARALSFDARLKIKRHDWIGALNDSLDAIAIGDAVGQHDGVLQKLVDIAVCAIGRRTAWPAVNHLDAADAQLAARRLEALDAFRPTESTTMAGEKVDTERCLVNLLRSSRPDLPAWNKSMFSDNLSENFYFTIRPRQKSLNLFDSYMNSCIFNTGLNYEKARLFASKPIPYDVVCATVIVDLPKQLVKDTDDLTQCHLLVATLALRAYYLDHHGIYPPTLAALVPHYLAQPPTDPFVSSTTPLVYRRVKDTYLLYSVGPDDIDNGGVPTVHHSPTSGESYRGSGQATDKGDIVAGINVD